MSNIISQTISTIRNWWVFLISGILLIAASIWVAMQPLESYVALAWLFSILVLVNGISYIYFSISNREFLKGWGWYLAGGLFEVVLGVGLLNYPEVSMIMLPLFVGFWFLFRGGQIIGVSLDLKEYGISDWGWIMLFGVGLTMIAFFMILSPMFAVFNVVYLTAISLLLFGISNIMLAFDLKKVKAQTIDKVDDFKKAIKKDFKTLQSQIAQAMKEASEEQKAAVDADMDEYEAKLD